VGAKMVIDVNAYELVIRTVLSVFYCILHTTDKAYDVVYYITARHSRSYEIVCPLRNE
jgi:hypothetical protein